jgi:hypothetical protein
MGYGEPVFNYYTQLPYLIGQVFTMLGFSILSSIKITYALSLILSGLSMYFLARLFWGRLGGIVSSLFYVYAPYRAVDVWVRGALPESLAFVFFPLLIYSLEKKRQLWFSILLSGLLLTHNLSFVMFLPFLGFWWLWRSRDLKFIKAGIVSGLLSAFYVVPIFFESHLVTLASTTSDYFLFPHHFTSLFQLFISNFWGYGGSIWGPNDTLSFSVGYLHWLVPLILLPIAFIKRNSQRITLAVIATLALAALFLTHGKSNFIWQVITPLSYVQFPWRFLGIASLFLSLLCGSLGLISKSPLKIILIVVAMVILNFKYFTPDIWRPLSDADYFSSILWDEQRASSLSDYWPRASGPLPTTFAPSSPQVITGIASAQLISKTAHKQVFSISTQTEFSELVFPIAYFPDWIAFLDGNPLTLDTSTAHNLITLKVPRGNHTISLFFKDTMPRVVGNIISLLVILYLFIRRNRAI